MVTQKNSLYLLNISFQHVLSPTIRESHLRIMQTTSLWSLQSMLSYITHSAFGSIYNIYDYWRFRINRMKSEATFFLKIFPKLTVNPKLIDWTWASRSKKRLHGDRISSRFSRNVHILKEDASIVSMDKFKLNLTVLFSTPATADPQVSVRISNQQFQTHHKIVSC